MPNMRYPTIPRTLAGLPYYLTSSEAASRLGIGREKLRLLTLAGDVKAVWCPMGYLYHPADLDRLAGKL